jgi:drug/metabolite transporter (DMT)-like permease
MKLMTLIIIGISFSALAQILLKISARQTEMALPQLITSLPLYGGLVAYAFAFISYLYILSRADISFASPLMIAGVTLIVFIYGFYTGEAINFARIAGASLILCGIALIGISAR